MIMIVRCQVLMIQDPRGTMSYIETVETVPSQTESDEQIRQRCIVPEYLDSTTAETMNQFRL